MKPAGQIKQQHSRRALFCTTTLSARTNGSARVRGTLFFFFPSLGNVYRVQKVLLFIVRWSQFPYAYQCVHLVCAFYDHPSSFLVLLLWQGNPLTVGYILEQSHSILSWALLTIHKVNPTGFFFFFFDGRSSQSVFCFFSCKGWAIPRAGNRNLVFSLHVLSFQAALAGAAQSVGRLVSTVTTASLPVIESS